MGTSTNCWGQDGFISELADWRACAEAVSWEFLSGNNCQAGQLEFLLPSNEEPSQKKGKILKYFVLYTEYKCHTPSPSWSHPCPDKILRVTSFIECQWSPCQEKNIMLPCDQAAWQLCFRCSSLSFNIVWWRNQIVRERNGNSKKKKAKEQVKVSELHYSALLRRGNGKRSVDNRWIRLGIVVSRLRMVAQGGLDTGE